MTRASTTSESGGRNRGRLPRYSLSPDLSPLAHSSLPISLSPPPQFVGEIAANFMGLTKSRYQWVIDQAERDEEMKQQKEREDAQRLRFAIERQLEEEMRRKEELEAELGGAANA